MIYIIVDTNFFIQCKDIEQVNWSEIISDPSQNVTLIIPRVVQRELDKHKSGGNDRRSSRARKANSLFFKIIKEDNPYTLNVSGFNFTIVLSAKNPTLIDGMARDINDDIIVAEAFELKNENPHCNVFILTNDTSMMVTCKNYSVEFFLIPDSFKLEREKDHRDKKIEELERIIKEKEKDKPIVSCGFYYENKECKEISIKKIVHEPLTKNQVDNLIKMIKEWNPMRGDDPEEYRDFSDSIRMRGLYPLHLYQNNVTPSMVMSYREKYNNWIDAIKKTIENINFKFDEKKNILCFDFYVANTGRMVLSDLILKISATEDIFIFLEKEKIMKKLTPPAFPTPQDQVVHRIPYFPYLPDMHDKKRQRDNRDPNVLYYQEKPSKPVNELIFECCRLHHGNDGVIETDLNVFFKTKFQGGKVSFQIWSADLPVEVVEDLIIKVDDIKTINSSDFFIEVEGFLREEFRQV